MSLLSVVRRAKRSRIGKCVVRIVVLRATWCARFCTPRLCGVGRGRRPRRPARTHRPPASSLCVRGAGGRGRPPLPCIRPCAPRLRGPAHHGCAALVGADALGGPRGRIVLRRRPCACVGRAAEDVRPYHAYGPARHMMCARPCTPRLCGVGRGRRPRRPARTHRPPASSLCAGRAAGDVRPYHVYGPAPHDVCGSARAVSARRCVSCDVRRW